MIPAFTPPPVPPPEPSGELEHQELEAAEETNPRGETLSEGRRRLGRRFRLHSWRQGHQ